ncbi:hypothetical protein IC229_29730 [Spirosoma sp. BT702]|uniref:Dystroglycan-type cadherin-like domain-containing protein n=1 Tax=Spirosoma profusum TaxID=2771354 RepID=A0A927AUW3_9BACT|nr:putative Ig domain-containing protein [Spirosoma profusum]MBD2704849.1 hypothetical protein [Spirosoma profusum]
MTQPLFSGISLPLWVVRLVFLTGLWLNVVSLTPLAAQTPRRADVGIRFSEEIPTVIPGRVTPYFYTISISNTGPDDAVNVNLTDIVPEPLMIRYSTTSYSNGTIFSDPIVPGTNTIHTTVVTLRAGDTARIRVAVDIPPSSTGTLSHSATVTVQQPNTSDTNPTNNSIIAAIQLTPQADLAVTLINSQTSVQAGSPVTYTMVVANKGPSNAPNARVSNAFSASMTGMSWTATGSGGGNLTPTSGAGMLNQDVSLPFRGSVTLVVTGTLAPTATGNLVHTATVAAPNGVSDLDLSNNVATDTDVIIPPPTITGFAASPSPVCVGSPMTFTATVGNVTGSYAYTLAGSIGSVQSGTARGNFSQSLTAVAMGQQSFTLTLSSGGQSLTASTSVTVSSLPVASLTSNGPLSCTLTSVTLMASGGSSYTFANGNGTLSTPGSSSTLVVNRPDTYSVRVANVNGCVSTTTTTVGSTSIAIAVTNPSVTTAIQDRTFSQLFSASEGLSPYSFSVASGNLPTGLNLSTQGDLSGIATQIGSFSITVSAIDPNGCQGTSSAYSLSVSAPNIRYVKPVASGNGSGNSWANASGDLQAMINAANVQQVWVARGTYKPGGNANTNTTISFSMKNGVAIYGGFEGNETSLDRRVLGHPSSSTLSGNIGRLNDQSDNSHVVVASAALDTTAELDGFVISDAYNYSGAGGGMYFSASSPKLRNLILTRNHAIYGAGMYIFNGSRPLLINCEISSNSAGSGAGIYNYSGSRTSLTNCVIRDNATVNNGAGAGIDNVASSSLVLTNCVISSNYSLSGGPGSGLHNYNDCFISLFNSTLAGNYGGPGAAVYNMGVLQLSNCVLWNNTSDPIDNSDGQSITATYSLFEQGTVSNSISGPTNLTTNISPFRSDTDLRLNACSNAINSGDPNATTATSGIIDLAGNPRFYNGGRIDMGAYEFQATPTSISITNPAVTTATQGVAFSQSFTAIGGQSPYSFSLASGSLPASLSLSAMGILSGTPSQTGTFPISVSATDAQGCAATGTIYSLTVINATPTISGLAATSSTVCVGSPVTVTATVGNVTGSYVYTLTVGAISLTGTQNSPTFSQSLTAAGSGSQTITLIIEASGQRTSVTTSLTVNPNPTPSLSATPSATLTCAQTSLTLTAGGGTTYVFSGPEVVSQNSTAGTAVINASGTYSVSVTTSGCTATTSIQISQDNVAPPVSISPSIGTPTGTTLSCTTPSVSLSAVGSGTYRWSTGAATSVISVTSAGTYSVTLTGANGCTAIASTWVTYQNCAPTLANAIPPQSATLGNAFSYPIPATTFTDAETPNSLTLSVIGLPAGLSFVSPNNITGTPSTTLGSPFTVTVTAIDSGGLSVSTSFVLTVQPRSFAITGVTMLDCNHTDYYERRINFMVSYEETNGQPISLSVVNELRATDYTGPYQLTVYTDNPVITITARQQGTPNVASFNYNWQANCANGNPRVENSIPPQSATVGQAFSYTIPANTFTDAETPNSLTLSVIGLPAGLSFAAPITIMGMVSATASSFYSVTVTATDAGGGSVSTILPLSVVNPGGCASMYTVKTGDWSDVSVWSCGRLPLVSDAVRLNHTVSLPASYQGQALQVIYSSGGRLLLSPNSRLRLGGN